ncbi:MAG: alpha/beta hydrolase [Proteobacteria bacterium]|nr:alpha/beta hydrolase [Pseudomonadota bacterium]
MTLVGIVRNPVPPGAVAGTFSAHDGVALRFARWGPPRRGSKGTVCVFGGRTEFIEKYFETISDLRQRGFAAATMDWRGQGGSSRPLRNKFKGHVEDFSQFESDLDLFMSEIVLPDCPPPYFALAHSMGANILIHAACKRDCWFERMVLSSPMIALRAGASLALIARLAQLGVFFGLGDIYVPGGGDAASGLEPFKGNKLTSDKRRHERNALILKAAPGLGLGSPTIGWLRAAAASMKTINAFGFAPRVHVPILMLAAGQDQVVSNSAIEELAAQLRAGSRVTLDGARHELLQERDHLREQLWSVFDAFVPGSP